MTQQQISEGILSYGNKSRRPHSHPSQHTQEEFGLIYHKHRYHRHKGLAQVYHKLRDIGYTITYDSMYRTNKENEIKSIKEEAILKLNIVKK